MKTKIKTTLALLAAFCGLQLFAASTPRLLVNLKTNTSADAAGWQNYTHESGDWVKSDKTYFTATDSSGVQFRINGTGGNIKGSFYSAGSTPFPTGSYVDVYGQTHTSLMEEIKTSLGLSTDITSDIYDTGMCNGANNGAWGEVKGLDPTKTYVMYVGFGRHSTNSYEPGFQLGNSTYGQVTSLDYVVTVGRDGSTVATDKYTSFDPSAQVKPGEAGGLMVVRYVGKSNADGNIYFSLNGERSAMNFLAISEVNITVPTPVAMWDSDFAGASGATGAQRGDFSIKANGNTLASDNGKITIATDHGVLVDWAAARQTASTAEGGFADKQITILVRYSNMAFADKFTCLGTVWHSNSDSANYDLVGVMGDKTNAGTPRNAYGISAGSAWTGTAQTRVAFPEGSQNTYTMAIVYHPSTLGTECYISQDGVTYTKHFGATSLMTSSSSYTFRGAAIGGVRVATLPTSNPVYGMTGLNIQKVAVFNTVLSTAEMAAYKFPTDPTAENATWGNLGTETTGVATTQNGAFGNSPWAVKFSAADNIVNTGFGSTGKVRIKSLTLMKRASGGTTPTSVTLTQNAVAIASTATEAVSSLKIYSASHEVLATRDGLKFTFPETAVFDVTKNVSLALVGGNGSSVVQPANSVMTLSSWSPALEFLGDSFTDALSEKYYNKLAGQDTVPAAKYGDIQVEGTGYAATALSSTLVLPTSGTGIGGAYTTLHCAGINVNTHTMSGWFKVTLPSSGNKLMWSVYNDTDSYGGYALVVDSAGKLGIARTSANSTKESPTLESSSTCWTSSAVLENDTWCYLTVSFQNNAGNDGTSGSVTRHATVKVYKNGGDAIALATEVNLIGCNGSASTSGVRLGSGMSVAGFYVDNGVLSDTTLIKALATNSKYVSPAPRYYTAQLTENKSWSQLVWDPALPESLLETDYLTVQVTGTPTLTFDSPLSTAANITIDGTASLAAGDDIYENGCWQKTVVSASSITATSATGVVKQGYTGAWTVGAKAITLRAQNKEVISLNIAGGDNSSGTSPDDYKVTGTGYAGLAPVQGNTWVNLTEKWGSSSTHNFPSIVATLDGATTIEKTDMSATAAANNTYRWATATDAFLKGYLDDGGTHAQVVVNNIPYSKYDVIIYAATDSSSGGKFTAPTVDNTTYTCGADGVAYAGNATWGTPFTKTAAFGVNAMVVKDLTMATLTIVGGANSGGCRGGIAAIQIVCTGDVVEEKDFTATISDSVTFSQIQWDGGKTFQEGSLNTATITVSGEASAGEVTITFDKPDMELNILKIISARPVKLAATEALSKVSQIDLSECTGTKTYAWPATVLNSSSDEMVAYAGGAGTAENRVAIGHNGGVLNLTGGEYHLAPSFSGTQTTVNMSNITADYVIPSGNYYAFAVGKATYNLTGTTAITTPAFWIGQGANNWDSVFNMSGTASLTVTGSTNGDNNHSSILFGHWNAATTFTMSDTATFTAASAQVLVGLTGNNQTINLNGGTFTAKGIKASTNAGGTNTLNLNGGTLVLGDVGITTYNNAKTIAVNVTGDSKIVASAAMPITQAILVSAGKTLTLDPNAATITVSSAITGSGNITVTDSSVGANGLVKFSGDLSGYTGTIALDANVTSVDFGPNRPTNVTFESDTTTVQFTELASEDGVLNVSSAFDGRTITVMGLDGKIHTLEGKKYAPSISGAATKYDYTFTNTLFSVGSTTTKLSRDTSYGLWAETNCFNAAGNALFTAADVYLDDPGYPTEWSASVFAKMPNVTDAVLMAFGTQGGGSVALIKGSGANDVILARTTGNSHYQVLTTMTVPNATTASHLYTFCKTANDIKIYLDSTLWTTYHSETAISFGNGFQMGSLHGGNGQTGFVQYGRNYWDSEVEANNSTVTMLRIFTRVIGPNTVKALSEAYPYHSPFGTYARNVTADGLWVAENAWSKEGAGTTHDQPAENSSVKLDNTGDSAVTLKYNRAENVEYEGLTLSGDHAITIAANDTTPKGGKIGITGLVAIGCDVTNKFEAIDISGSPLSVSDGKTLTIDFSCFDLSTYYTNAEYTATGTPNLGTGAKVEAVLPTAVAGRTATFAVDPSTGCYKLTIAMAGPITGAVNKDGTWGADGVITWRAGEVEITEPDWSVYTSPATLVVAEGNDYTLTYGTGTRPATIAKAGAGTLAITAGNNGKSYVVDAGTLKFATIINQGAATVTVNPNGTFDMNGQGGSHDPKIVLTLAGGKLVNNGQDFTVNQVQFTSITLTADSTVGGTKNMYFTSGNYAANTLELGGHKLSKVDNNTFGLCNTTVKNGTLAVEAGTLDIAHNAATFNDNATLVVADAATLKTSVDQTFGGTMSRWSSVTGSVVVADGTLQIGDNTGAAKGEYKFGKSITVNSGKTLRLWIWATRDQTFNRNTKAVLTTPVTLNGSTIYTQDGAYWFDSITVNGANNTMQFNWNKSHGIGSLNGDANAALTLTRSQSESFRQYFAIDGGDFNGTLTVNNTDGGADSDFWLSPKGEVLKDATVLCQGTGRPTYIVIRDDATLGEVTGDKFAGIFGDGVAAHSVTLTQGTYAAPIKDISTGTSGDYPLSVVVDGNVTITGESAYTGTTTINADAKLDAALGEGLPRASTITIAAGGRLVVDLENFVTVAETSPAYTFSGDLPANALDIKNQDKYPWISIGTSGGDLGKVIIDQTKLPFTGLHIVKMLPKHTSKTADRDPNGRDSGWIDIVNYGPTATNLSNYKIVRSNIGKKVKSDDKDLARLCSYTLPKGGTFRVYTSEEYETAEDYGGKGKDVAWFTTVEGVVTKLTEYQEGAIMVVPTKVNPKKFPMVRLYDYSTNAKGDVIDEIIVPCDMDDNMMLEVVANTNKLERRVVYPNGEKVECGPVVNSLYGVKDVKGDLDLMKPGKFAPAGQAYPVKIPVNPLMTGGKALDANTITGVNLIYRVFDPTAITVSNKVALTSRTIEAGDPDVAKYGEGCLLWEGDIPAEAMATAGKLVQFRAEITDNGGKTWIYPNNMNPDIGYGWYGVVVEPTIIATPGSDITSTSVCTNSLQTFLMFIDDTNKAQMDKDIDDPTLTLTYGARLAIYDVANHTYYDNVRIDLRGQTSKTFYKKSHGIRFNKVAPLVAKDPFTGDKYETRKTSFIAEYGDPMYLRQTLALRLMRESGVKAPFDWPVRLYLNGTFYQLAFHSSRFSDEAVEDFYGLNKYGYSYKNVHQLTQNCGAEKKTPDDDNESDLSVLNQYAARIESETPAAGALTTDAMKHFNIPAWVNYLAAVRVTQEADDVWTNLGIYINKYDSFFNANGDDTMMPLAYDQNLSWGQWYFRDDTDRGHIGIVATNDYMKSHPFYGGKSVRYYKWGRYPIGVSDFGYNRGMEVILQDAQFREMLTRRLRTLAEQYLGAQDATKEETPVWDWVVAYTNAIAGDVQIDRTMWKYDEKVISTTTNIWVWSTALTFDEGVEDLWANYIVPRRKHLYDTHAAKNAGKTGYPAAGGGYATGSSALIPETQPATETFGKRGALYFTDLNGKKPGEDGFDITTDKILGICNTNNVAIDMSGWTVEGAVVATLKPGTVIPTNSVLWIVDDRRAASDKVVAKGLTKPIVVNLDKTLVDDDGNPIEVFTDATDQLFLKDADGTPAITHEATIGTKYYITLLDAFNCAAAGDIVALLTDINNQTPAEVKTSVFLYGDTNTLTGAGFDVADGQTLTIASGQIANGALAKTGSGNIVLIGGKYTNQDYSDIVSNQYHMAALGLPEGVYTYQVVPGASTSDDEIVLPVAQVEETTSTTNDTGVLAFSKDWLVKQGLAETKDFDTPEGKKKVVNNLNKPQTNHIQAWENKVLGLDGSKAENIPVILPKQTEDATKVTFKMADQDKVSTDSGAIVTYKVWMGSTPKGKDKGSSEAVLYTEDTAMPLPKDGVQYYMLEVITTPAK